MKPTQKETALKKKEAQPMAPAKNRPEYIPATDIYEKEDAILVRCDMPGVAQENVDIQLEHNELKITGTQSEESMENLDRLATEYDQGVFRRTFEVPHQIDRDRIEAKLRNGVLDIVLPKAEEAKPRKIEITTGE